MLTSLEMNKNPSVSTYWVYNFVVTYPVRPASLLSHFSSALTAQPSEGLEHLIFSGRIQKSRSHISIYNKQNPPFRICMHLKFTTKATKMASS
jgi:hypothetical protein